MKKHEEKVGLKINSIPKMLLVLSNTITHNQFMPLWNGAPLGRCEVSVYRRGGERDGD